MRHSLSELVYRKAPCATLVNTYMEQAKKHTPVTPLGLGAFISPLTCHRIFALRGGAPATSTKDCSEAISGGLGAKPAGA